MIKRREFVTLLGGGAAAAWPMAVRAQQADRMRRIGVLIPTAADDPETHSRLTALLHELQSLGWTNGRNIHIDIRSSASDAERIRNYTAELATFRPDVILAVGSPATRALLQASHAVPIVFVQVVDPVGSGFVESLAHPGGNATGFEIFEFGMSGNMAGTAQRDRAARGACGGPAGLRKCRGDWRVRRHPLCGTVVGNGIEFDRIRQRERDRTWHRRFCARARSGTDCGGRCLGARSPRADHHACGPAPVAGGLS